MERSEVWESGIVGIGVEKSLSGEGRVEDDSLKAHLGGYEAGLEVAAKRFLTEFFDYVTGAVGSDSPIVGTLVYVAWGAVDKYLWRFMEERFHQPAGSHDKLILEPLVAPAKVAEEMVVGDIVGLEMTCCHVIACDKLTFGIVVEETDNTLGRPQGVVLSGETDDMTIILTTLNDGREQFAMVLHLTPASPTYPMARNEMNLAFEKAVEGTVIDFCIDMNIEVTMVGETLYKP